MSTAPDGFINEVNVTNAFQSLKLKSSSGHDGLSNLALKYAARELFPAVHQHRRTSRLLAHYKNHPSAQKVIYGRLSKNVADFVQSGASQSS